MGLSEADRERIQGRKLAEEVLEMLEDESISYREGFWRRIKRNLKTREIDPKAMSDEDARMFGKKTVKFGKWMGSRYDDVPLSYWTWLADENNQVQRYLRSRRIRAEIS